MHLRGNSATTRTYHRQPLAILVLTCVLLLGAAMVGPMGSIGKAADRVGLGTRLAAAHTTGGSATGGGQWHPWPSDACTKVPNTMPGIFNFTHACQHHDGCYVNRWSSDKATCDRWFLNDMVAGCGWWNSSCLNWAAAYYAGVRACGGYSWDNRSVSTPMSRLCW